MARLVVIVGTEEGREIALPAYPCVIGREEGCDVRLDDQRMSRQHACVRLERGRWVIRDLETSNGTHIGGRRTEGWEPLAHGDRVQMGRTLLRFEDDAPGPRAAPSGGADAAAARAAPRLPAIPGYDGLEEVGSGATCTVYRARRVALDRVEAVKVLSRTLSSRPEAVAAFEREARAAAALSHENVVRVHDVGSAGSLHWFTMEFMEGGTVEDLLLTRAGSRLPWRDAVAIVSAAAHGLAYVHRQGFVHRDVKPANLLLDGEGRAKLADLGTVVHVDEALAQRIGTPHFMSPEQARREPVTRASDVYSLGATLYRMLAGRPPHRGDDVRTIVRSVAEETPVPIARLCRNLPEEVAAVVGEMMSPDPARRPTDADAVGRRLAAALEEVQVSRETRRRVRRRRFALDDWGSRIILLAAIAVALYLLRDKVLGGLAEILDAFR